MRPVRGSTLVTDPTSAPFERTGAPGDGWHEVVITIPRLPKAEIAAKRGYFVDKK